VIFGFDQSQKVSVKKQKQALIDYKIKEEFILMKGSSNGFCVGISK